MTTRESVEAALDAERAALLELVDVLSRHANVDAWSPVAVRRLAGALQVPDDPGEARKARALCRHLFRRAEPPGPFEWRESADRATVVAPHPENASTPDPREGRIVERIRADLYGLVPLGSGERCLPLTRTA